MKSVSHRRVERMLRDEVGEGEVATVADVTSAYALLQVQGPRSRELLARGADAGVSEPLSHPTDHFFRICSPAQQARAPSTNLCSRSPSFRPGAFSSSFWCHTALASSDRATFTSDP